MTKGRWIILLAAVPLLALAMAWIQRRLEPHGVTLTWQAPPPKPGVNVAGYNIYRRTADGGPFVKIAARVLTSPYEDRLVSRGRTYYYVVTTVDQNDRESRFSSEAKAEIP